MYIWIYIHCVFVAHPARDWEDGDEERGGLQRLACEKMEKTPHLSLKQNSCEIHGLYTQNTRYIHDYIHGLHTHNTCNMRNYVHELHTHTRRCITYMITHMCYMHQKHLTYMITNMRYIHKTHGTYMITYIKYIHKTHVTYIITYMNCMHKTHPTHVYYISGQHLPHAVSQSYSALSKHGKWTFQASKLVSIFPSAIHTVSPRQVCKFLFSTWETAGKSQGMGVWIKLRFDCICFYYW